MSEGSLQVSATCPSPTAVVMPVGAAGRGAGTADTPSEAAPDPAGFSARIWNAYLVPVVKSSTM